MTEIVQLGKTKLVPDRSQLAAQYNAGPRASVLVHTVQGTLTVRYGAAQQTSQSWVCVDQQCSLKSFFMDESTHY
ncbi:UNVERIFIED_CONTAM: hypothetical protein NCL1_35521 [Trichonephila clavipes]